jgi:hypothetical protein
VGSSLPAGARAQAGHRFDDQREAVGQVVAGTAVEAHPRALLPGNRALLPGNDAEAVVLDLVHPGIPLGGCGTLVGRQSGTKPRGRGMAAE